MDGIRKLTAEQLRVLQAFSSECCDAEGWADCTSQGERPYRFGARPTRAVLERDQLIQTKVVEGRGYFVRVTDLGRKALQEAKPRVEATKPGIRFMGYQFGIRKVSDLDFTGEPLSSGTISG